MTGPAPLPGRAPREGQARVPSGPNPADATEKSNWIISLWRRLPSRLSTLLSIPLTLAVWITFSLAVTTVTSLYPGPRMDRWHTSEQAAWGEVRECRRVGPVSAYGFGYWWQCRVRVHLDGEVAEGVLGRSVVGPDDTGGVVKLVAVCYGSSAERCSYGRPGNILLALAVAIVVLVQRGITVFVFLLVCHHLLVVVFGERRADLMLASFDRWRSGRKAPPFLAWVDAPPGTISLTLRRPGTARWCAAASPRVVLSGRTVPISGWGRFRIPVRPRGYRLRIFIPGGMGHKAGHAATDLVVAPGQEVVLEYVAPRRRFGRGRLIWSGASDREQVPHPVGG